MSAFKSLRDLEKEWYKKLEEKGFLDIENTLSPNRPLIEWHSFKMTSERFQIIQATRAQYQTQIDEFMHHPSFREACKSVVNHGNSKFSAEEAAMIWWYHTQGMTTRKIAGNLRRVKSRIDDIIKGLREWMTLL